MINKDFKIPTTFVVKIMFANSQTEQQKYIQQFLST